MSSVFLTAIVIAACDPAVSSGQQKACPVAVEAAAEANGVFSKIQEAEKILSVKLENMIKKELNEKSVQAISGSILITRYILGDKVIFKLGQGFLDANYAASIKKDENFIYLDWNF